MKNKKKNRSSYSLSAELKNALKYLLIWGMILIFSAYLLSDSEILGNVKQHHASKSQFCDKHEKNHFLNN